MALDVVHLNCEVDNSAPFHLYDALETGRKRYELRLLLKDAKGVENKWGALRPWRWSRASLTVVNASDKSQSFTRAIVGTNVRVGYRALLELVGVEQCVPGATSVEDAIERVYKRFYPHHLEGYEVIAIELAPV